MADRPINLHAHEVRGILSERQTMLRRVLKPQPEKNSAGLWVWPPNETKITKRNWRGFCQTNDDGLRNFFLGSGKAREVLPGNPSDRLWARETWAQYPIELDKDRSDIWYRADGREPPSGEKIHSWKSPIFMPRWGSRITLTVTEVRVQRLQDISEADARAEGIRWTGTSYYVVAGDPHPTFKAAFAALWDSLHGPGSWAANPWCAAISFTTRMGNING
jgi:hypothetical protein